MSDLADHLARNLKHLRDARGLTQQQMAKLSGLPRPTWANLESGAANPTLAVLSRVAAALQVSIEELVSTPRGLVRFHPKETLGVRRPGNAILRRLVPDPIPGMEVDRIELPRGGRFTGVPHTPGTREYLTCETGRLTLFVGGEEWKLSPGDVVSFRGDQKHSYLNPAEQTSVGFSLVILAPVG
jgi:XRE family transcriptional regulator, regulator of sulfur utilization